MKSLRPPRSILSPDFENSIENAPIGIFDSGVGGLSVAAHIRKELPSEKLLYIADSAYLPYGNKSDAEIEARSQLMTEYLVSRGIKALVVACNTATAAAIEGLRALYTFPIIGMEPAVKPAVALTRNGIIGVLATTGTLNSEKFYRLQLTYGQDAKIITQACPGLVELIESGSLEDIETEELAAEYIGKLLSAGADTLVLGCTHFPFLLPLFRKLAGPEIEILDTGIPVSRQLRRQLEKRKLVATQKNRGGLEILTTGEIETARTRITKLWGSRVPISALEEKSLKLARFS